MEDRDPLAPARGIMWGLALGLLMWAALFAGICGGSKIAHADHKACAHPVLPMPRTVVGLSRPADAVVVVLAGGC